MRTIARTPGFGVSLERVAISVRVNKNETPGVKV